MSLLTFWAQGDFVIRFVAIALLALSVSTWVVILWKFSLLRRVKADVDPKHRSLLASGPV
jgi:biopolymer transport protein ExbB